MFLFLFVFLVLFVSLWNHQCVSCCVCVVWFSFLVTGLSGFLGSILWSCFLFGCFVLNFCLLLLFHPSPKQGQKTDTAKTQKAEMQKKGTKNQLAQLCSQIEFPIFGVAEKMQFLLKKRYRKSGFGIFWKGKWPKHVKKVESKLGPRLSQNLVQACCAKYVDQAFGSKTSNVFFFFGGTISFSLQKEEYFEKKENEENLGQVSTQKGKFWAKFWLDKTYIYIYMRCRVKTWSKIWVFLRQNLVQGCVKTWSKIFFACFSLVL